MQKRILVLAKTKMAADTRVLNQIKLLTHIFPESKLVVLNLPTDPVDLKMPENVAIKEIKIPLRNKRITRPFTALFFWIACLAEYVKFRPHIVHCHDTATAPIGLVLTFFSRFTRVIYDDHEMPDTYKKERLMIKLEELLIERADMVIFANEMRHNYLREKQGVSPKRWCVFENVCPFHEIRPLDSGWHIKYNEIINSLVSINLKKYKIKVLHQGSLNEKRRSDLAYEAVIKNPETLFVFLAPGKSKLISKISKLENVVVLDGVPSSMLDDVWKLFDYSMIFYESASLNNNYCAPNRVYLALKNKVPFIFNSDNESLSSLSARYGGGVPYRSSLTFPIEDDCSHIKVNYQDILNKQKTDFTECYRLVMGL